MKKSAFIALVFLFAAGLVSTLYADPGIEVFRTMPEEGTYTEIGELHLSRNQINEDAAIVELQRQAEDMGADAIVLFDRPAAGDSLIMTGDRLVVVGVAIKYE